MVSVGEHCYLAMTKGGLTEAHFVIVPIQHAPSSVYAHLEGAVLAELDLYKRALFQCLESRGSAAVLFNIQHERIRHHAHWHVVGFEDAPGVQDRVCTDLQANSALSGLRWTADPFDHVGHAHAHALSS